MFEPAPPHACRTLKSMLKAIAPLLQDDAYLSMSRGEFTAVIFKSTGGGQNPRSISEWYDRLMTDAYGDGFEKFVKNGTFTPRSL